MDFALPRQAVQTEQTQGNVAVSAVVGKAVRWVGLNQLSKHAVLLQVQAGIWCSGSGLWLFASAFSNRLSLVNIKTTTSFSSSC